MRNRSLGHTGNMAVLGPRSTRIQNQALNLAPLSLWNVNGFFFFLTFFLIYLFIYLFILAALGLRCCVRAFSGCGEWGLLFVVRCGAWAMEHRLSSCGLRPLEHRLSSCGSRAYLLHAMWDLPGPRAWTRVSCIGKWILNHCATREVPCQWLLKILCWQATVRIVFILRLMMEVI